MPHSAHLWAIGYEDAESAERLRTEINLLSETDRSLDLYDIAILSVKRDGTYSLDRKPFPKTGVGRAGGILDFIAGFVLAAPMYDVEAADAFLGGMNANFPRDIGIDAQFVNQVRLMLRPGSAALLALTDSECNLADILKGIHGFGGTVLRATADPERLQLIRSTLNAHQDEKS
jgi:uncharacterized membrane protein